jgi:hypothetical protein
MHIRSIVLSVLAGIWFLVPWNLPAARAQQDEKDLEIKLLKAKIEVQQKEFELVQKQAKATTDRLKRQIDELNDALKERETMVIELKAVVRKYKVIADESEIRAKFLQVHIETLLDELRGKKPALEATRNPNDPNPPSVEMSSKIEKVEGTLVQISLGTDHGLKENNTLFVYRLKPEPKYLGMIRIVDARHHISVGRLISVGKAEDRPTLNEGDLVTSKLPLQEKPKKKNEPPKDDDKGQGKKAEPPKGTDFPLGFAKANPPADKIDGKIEKMEGDLVRLNVGRDHGVYQGSHARSLSPSTEPGISRHDSHRRSDEHKLRRSLSTARQTIDYQGRRSGHVQDQVKINKKLSPKRKQGIFFHPFLALRAQIVVCKTIISAAALLPTSCA